MLGLEIGGARVTGTAATNALDHQADIVEVQEWLGMPISRRQGSAITEKTKPEDSPTVKEPLSKSPLARRRLCGMGCAKGDDANG